MTELDGGGGVRPLVLDRRVAGAHRCVRRCDRRPSVDPRGSRRAPQQGPFGTTIGHGYLTLSLLPAMSYEVVPRQDGGMAVNYGLNKVRFPAPVPSGSRVRGTFRVDCGRGVRLGLPGDDECDDRAGGRRQARVRRRARLPLLPLTLRPGLEKAGADARPQMSTYSAMNRYVPGALTRGTMHGPLPVTHEHWAVLIVIAKRRGVRRRAHRPACQCECARRPARVTAPRQRVQPGSSGRRARCA